MIDARESARESGVADPEGLFLLWLDDGRRLPRVHLYRSNVPAEVANAVAARAVPILAAWPDTGEVHLTLRLDSLPKPEPLNTVRELCQPALDNADRMPLIVDRHLRVNRGYLRQAPNGGQASVKMLVDRKGNVAYSEISRTSSDSRIDEVARRIASEMRFRPATIDGVPVDVWVELPVSVPGAR